ncbi:MAG: hypothetical protein AAGM45_21610 [Cyanobacteria bacterium J06588_5]
MDHREANQTVLIPKLGGIQAEIETRLFPIRQRCLDDGLVESMDVDAGIPQPSTNSALTALSILPAAGDVLGPFSQVYFARLYQRGDQP